MLLLETITQLRSTCPLFEQRVMGTQNLVALQSENADITVPSCFVVPMSESAQDTEGNRTAQKVTERFATIVCLDNSVKAADGRGVSAVVGLSVARRQLLDAMIGWTPPTMPYADTVKYARGQFLWMTNGRLWYQYEWNCGYMVNGQPEGQPSWREIEKVINSYWPNVDPTNIKQVFVGQKKRGDLSPVDLSLYDKIIDDINGVSATNISFVNRLDEANHFGPEAPGNVITEGVFTLKNGG